MNKIVERHRSYLPHIQLEGQIISLTWRLAFTLPKNLLKLQTDLEEELAEIRRENTSDLSVKYAGYIQKLEDLDTYLGKLELNDLSLCADENPQTLISAINFYAGNIYELHSYCIMPNHLHLLIRPLPGQGVGFHKVSTTVQRLKSYTAKMINQKYERQGKIWHRDYFDRFIRNPDDYRNVVNYILANPVKAGLVKKAEDWKYSYYCPGLI
jgi:REP element-mobilizing transposase RayT